jgi:PAS domain S-box-containing protein
LARLIQVSMFREYFSIAPNATAIAGVVMLGAVVAATYVSLDDVSGSLREERLTLRVLTDIEGLQSSLREIDSVRSQYALSGDPSLLARFDTLREKVRVQLAEIEHRVELPEQRVELPAIKSTLEEHLAVAAELMNTRNRGPNAPQLTIPPGRAELAGSARGLVNTFELRNRSIVAERERTSSGNVGFMRRAILAGMVLAGLLLGWSLLAGQRYERARQAAETALQGRSRELRLLIDAMPAMIAYVSADERFLLHNRSYAQWLDIPSAQIDGHPVREVLGEKSYAVIEPHLKRALAGEEVRYERQETLGDGRLRDLAIAYVPHRGTGGGVLGCYALLTDITDLKHAGRLGG